MKLCVDCKYYNSSYYTFPEHRCLRKTGGISLVTGQRIIEVLNAEEERTSKLFSDRCGEKGVYFEPLVLPAVGTSEPTPPHTVRRVARQ